MFNSGSNGLPSMIRRGIEEKQTSDTLSPDPLLLQHLRCQIGNLSWMIIYHNDHLY